MQWFFSEQYSYEPNIATVRHRLAHFGRDLAEPPFLERRRNGEAVLDLMDGHLAEQAFFLGDDFTFWVMILRSLVSSSMPTHMFFMRAANIWPTGGTWLDRVADQPEHITIDDNFGFSTP